MKSQLFSEFDVNDERNKGFRRDLDVLTSLSGTVLRHIAEGLPGLTVARTAPERRPLVEKLAATTSLEIIKLENVASIADFFLRSMGEKQFMHDEPADWVADLKEAKLLNQAGAKRLLVFLTLLKTEVEPTIKTIRKDRKAAARVFPSLSSCDTNIDMRGVVDEEYPWGTPLKDYEPRVSRVIPMVSVRITVDKKDRPDFAFQATPEELEYLINELLSAQKKVASLRKYLHME